MLGVQMPRDSSSVALEPLPSPNHFPRSGHPVAGPNPAPGCRCLCNRGKRCSTSPSLPNAVPPQGCLLSSPLFSSFWRCQRLPRMRWEVAAAPGPGFCLISCLARAIFSSTAATAGNYHPHFSCLGPLMIQSGTMFPAQRDRAPQQPPKTLFSWGHHRGQDKGTWGPALPGAGLQQLPLSAS